MNVLQPAYQDEVSPGTGETNELRRMAAALVQLEAYARQRGLDELAGKIEVCIDYLDHRLTGGGLP
ncbi:hypothetical protein [Parvularcula dongshanensis]|uniref:Uncharacterized protein n=1 Tax=Parvularcula dongshanensis TaxID=1173995 RepID=A0A840I3F6_9PROT|nr:hypothetical protein [Parvularcula dongshanensis]MBB4659307.1 hypothetical protein [Parvularcula dongshanensis]